jgi:hypothetical protein
METTGRIVNDKVRACGVVALVDLAGDRIWFYPRGRLPPHLGFYLDSDHGRPARLLRDFCVSLGRGVVND